MEYRVFHTDPNSGCIMSINYPQPIKVDVLNHLNQKINEVGLNADGSVRELKSLCGSNRFIAKVNILEFFMTGATDCQLYLNTSDSVVVNMKINVPLSTFF